jgi:hypothetical protein
MSILRYSISTYLLSSFKWWVAFQSLQFYSHNPTLAIHIVYIFTRFKLNLLLINLQQITIRYIQLLLIKVILFSHFLIEVQFFILGIILFLLAVRYMLFEWSLCLIFIRFHVLSLAILLIAGCKFWNHFVFLSIILIILVFIFLSFKIHNLIIYIFLETIYQLYH